MKTFKFKKIDAFTNGSSCGNPAGAVYPDFPGEISPYEMQKIARELKGFVSEVGFLLKTGDTAYDLKYYSSEREVEFCGHATIAIMYDLISNSEYLLSRDVIQIRNNKGLLSVYNKIKTEDAVFVSAPKPVYRDRHVPLKMISEALCTDQAAISRSMPSMTINAGLETLIVPVGTLDGIIGLKPDIERLKGFCIDNGIDIVTVYSNETADSRNSYRTRVFAPTFGYLEDPATGSGNAAFGYYLVKNGFKPEGTLSIEQNGSRDNANIVKLELTISEDGTPQVLFGGNAVVKITGEYFLI